MRTQARETLFKLLYSSQFSDGGIDGELKDTLYKNDSLDSDDIAYCERILNIVEEHSEEFIKIIDERSVAFPEKRVFRADKSILLIGLAEIKYCDDIPLKVSLNEAANIASKYSSEKSASFITGILSAEGGAKNV